MTVENLVYLLQQAGAVVLAIILIYQLHQWIGSSSVSDERIRITLQEAKAQREEALERSMQILSKADLLNNLEVVPFSTRKELKWNKLQLTHVNNAAKMSNAVKEREIVPTVSGLKRAGNTFQEPFSHRR